MLQVEELNHKKHAIYIALLSYLNPEQARNAIEIWLNEFSDKSVYELQSFITRITNEFSVHISRKDVQQTIIKMLLNDTNQLQKSTIDIASLPTKKKSTELKPPEIIFSLLITRWLNEINLLNADTALKIKRYISNNLENIDVSFDEMMHIKTWLNSSDKNIYMKDLEISQMKSIFHICYVGSCEYIGPVKTDHIVSEISSSIEHMPEAMEFSTKEFF